MVPENKKCLPHWFRKSQCLRACRGLERERWHEAAAKVQKTHGVASEAAAVPRKGESTKEALACQLSLKAQSRQHVPELATALEKNRNTSAERRASTRASLNLPAQRCAVHPPATLVWSRLASGWQLCTRDTRSWLGEASALRWHRK